MRNFLTRVSGGCTVHLRPNSLHHAPCNSCRSAAFGDVKGSVGKKPADYKYSGVRLDPYDEYDMTSGKAVCPHVALVYALHRSDQGSDNSKALLTRATQLSQALHKVSTNACAGVHCMGL